LKQTGRHAFVVHGDTVTTVLGALMGRLHRTTVVHVEAGLRSFNWRHPFPEEIDRMIVSRLARYHFAPGQTPIDNLHKAEVKGKIVDTKRNTVLDSLRYARAASTEGLDTHGADLSKPYYVISIHRNELMSDEAALHGLLETIQKHAQTHDIQAMFLDHPITKERLTKLGYDNLLDHENIFRMPKLSYYRFIQLVSNAKYIITDSGGLQEEAAYLDIPCLVHRMATERQEGLGENVVLSLYDQKKVDQFLANPDKYHGQKAEDSIKPTQTIITTLRADGFIG
jgi:UDP-N-acetylglucosamine 2-epimerase (non-hydrolysing)